jgi:hypothetical protein
MLGIISSKKSDTLNKKPIELSAKRVLREGAARALP